MSIYDSKEIRQRMVAAFPRFFVNHNFEAIIYPPRNSYFILAGVETEKELIAKMLEWLSREASKSVSRQSQKYHLDGINTFLATNFSASDMDLIYTYLGNRCNHQRTLRFIESGYDLATLTERGA